MSSVHPANGQETCYTDRGVEVCFPLGDISFADEIIVFEAGSPRPPENSSNPSAALGIPNYDPEQDNLDVEQEYLTMGCEGTLTVRFTNNALVDVEGPDLYVFEIGGDVESTYLQISQNGTDWVDVGIIEGATAEIDIAEFITPGNEFSFVRLRDIGSACAGEWPGADIDAIGAVGSTFVETGPHISFVSVEKPYEEIENAVMDIAFRVMVKFDAAPDEPPKNVRIFSKSINGHLELELEATDKPEIFVSKLTVPNQP